MKRAGVLVLGDYGRSPRMQYHTLSLLQSESMDSVHVFAYIETAPLKSITDHGARVSFHALSPPLSPGGLTSGLPRALRLPAFLVLAAVRLFLQTLQLLYVLLRAPRLDVMIVQNPPSIPTLAVVRALSAIRGTRIILDWHNYGHSLIVGGASFVASLARRFEHLFGGKAYAHLTVTRAMAADLSPRVSPTPRVLYDRPPAHFARLSTSERHAFFSRTQDALFPPHVVTWLRTWQRAPADADKTVPPTPFTYVNTAGDAVARPDRPLLVLSSTSWTEDEDFSLLLAAIDLLEDTSRGAPILFVITGKGPTQARYLPRITSRVNSRAAVCTAWLAIEDYPLLLGAGDLGVSLHSSSSGLDLPMKVVDMFGCGLPVCALGFAALPELVQDRKNGFIFGSAEELAGQIEGIARTFPDKTSVLDGMARMAAGIQRSRWEDNWKSVVGPLLEFQV